MPKKEEGKIRLLLCLGEAPLTPKVERRKRPSTDDFHHGSSAKDGAIMSGCGASETHPVADALFLDTCSAIKEAEVCLFVRLRLTMVEAKVDVNNEKESSAWSSAF